MSNYVLAFRSRPDRQRPSDEDAAWGAWFADLGSAVVDTGHRVGEVTTLAAKNAVPEATVLTGYILISADTLDDAARLASGCPGLANGVSVEVGEAAA